jgi:protease-4
MTRWMLPAVAVLTMAFTTPADPPKKNPFTDPGVAVKDPALTKPEKAVPRVAHVKLSGDLDESPPGEALFGPPKENLKMTLDRIRKAAKDERVQALYLQIGSLDAGFGKLNELRRAIADFKKTGKKVFAYAEEYGTKEYLVACGADQVVMPESGGISLYGLRAEVTYYKNTLDLLKLKADVLKMGDYKSAVEPFISDKMSAANREQIQSMLDDNFENEIAATIAAGRKLPVERVKEIIDGGPYTAKKAQALGLVSSLQYEDQFETSFAKALGTDEAKVERNYGKAKGEEVDFSNPFKMLEALSGPKKKAESKEPKIAVIYAVGGIASGKSSVDPLMGGETVGSDTLVAAIRQADRDETVKAIVLRIDSPGGSALARDVMWRALRACKKPVVASMGDVAASGGYYIAAGTQKIYAEPGTITGSIGVFGLKLVTGGLQEWGGMKTEVVARGKNSGVNSSTFPWSDSERQVMTEVIEDVYDMFLTKALDGRKRAGKSMTRDELVRLAGGRVWTGRQARANGLVDELGTLDDAVAGAKDLAGLDPEKEMELLILPKGSSFLEKLMEGESGLPFGSLTTELRKLPGAERALRVLAPLLRTQKDPAKVMLPYLIEWK